VSYIYDIKHDGARRAIRDYYRENWDLLNLRPPTIDGSGPIEEDVGGGLIVHCDKVAWLCVRLATARGLSDADRDLLLMASYLHDVSLPKLMGYKRHVFNFEGAIVRGYDIKMKADLDALHALKSAKFGCAVVKDIIEHEELVKLYHIIERHMGQRCVLPDDKAPPQPETELEILFAIADYLASREGLYINVDPDDNALAAEAV